MTEDCAALQLTPAECEEWLTPAPPPDGAGWLAIAMVLALALAVIVATDEG